MQGDRAVPEIAARARALDAEPDVDVIVITRGGGSLEDLLPFSDEALCRAIAACGTAVVSAVGHERDVPLCDLVADARASTPTDAARLIVPDARQELENVERLRSSAAEREGRRALREARLASRRSPRGPRCAAPDYWVISRREASSPTAGSGSTALPRTLAGGQRAERAERARRRGCARSRRRRRSSAAMRSCSTIAGRRARRGGARARRAGRPAARARRRRRAHRGGQSGWMSEPVEELSFEAARDELEQVVQRLEDGSTSLERGARAVGARRGALPRPAARRLEAAEARIEKLAEALAEPPPGARPRAQDSGIGPT